MNKRKRLLSWFRYSTRGIYRAVGSRLDLFYNKVMPFPAFRQVPAASRLNLCCGQRKIAGYIGVDIYGDADLAFDLASYDLPYEDESMDAVVCMSGINYFTRTRAQGVIHDIYRVLRKGGIARFGVQDMNAIAKRYVDKDATFFFQKTDSGNDRFEGPTLGDKFAAWFYGYVTPGGPTRYFYDYDSLALLFREAGFSAIEKRSYQDSRLDNISEIDNRPEQMFYLEAVK